MTHHHAAHDHHNHEHHHPPANYDRAFGIGLTLNLGFVLIEAFYGFQSNSIALLADAGHNLSDVLGLGLAGVAAVLSRRRPSSRFTYGWRRSSILAAFFNAVFLMAVTAGIAWEALQRLQSPSPIAGETVIVVAAIGIAVNTATALLFMSGRKGDMNIRAAFLHMAADALVSLGVVIAGIGILLTGWLWLDPIFSLLISALIVFNTWEVLRDSFSLAIDGVPPNVDQRSVRLYLAEYPGVAQLHDLHIWGMSTTETALTAHLVMPAGHPGDACLLDITCKLQEHFGITHATLQVETGDLDCSCSLKSEQSN